MSPVTIYRCVRLEPEGLPELGASLATLGVRPRKDIPVRPDGTVEPVKGGMSVTPDDPNAMPFDLLPRSRGGDGRHPIFEFQVAQFPATLTARKDAPDHANVEPTAVMQFNAYNSDVQGTRPNWVKLP